ncbi:hypothetical protein SAMN05192534_12317 [Alteribacillus persepolensis]|uniref:Uncharacterized protein n=1 Tax=Alteribacillus persepolensis TaxID=568899 RepID=A0A1G8I6P2_9BACI|nr:hypothetical protein [Alteribacillus persepolensis]SDI14626.1 hypothetical protein SAMN05192534_12317 [Alteribacillus persepolensis]
MNPDYWKGYHDGRQHAINQFCERFEAVQKQKGIGEKTIRKLAEAMKLQIKEVEK